MPRDERIRMARRLLCLLEQQAPADGASSWETDVARFIDPQRHETEQQKLFGERPQLIALSADLPDPGSYYATEVAGRPILLVRGTDGEVRAFFNACRHRGMPLASGCGRAGRLQCPYHGWTYRLDGALAGLPRRSAFDPSHLRGLIQLPSIERSGMVLIHLQPGATLDFDAFLGPVAEHLEGFNLENCTLLHAHRGPARINWKLAVDAGLEIYHVPVLHKDSLGPNAALRPLSLTLGMHQVLVAPSPEILLLKHLPEAAWPAHCGFASIVALFPNTVIGGNARLFFFQRSEPGPTPGSCDYVFRLYGQADLSPEERAASVQFYLKIALDEEMPALERLQATMERGVVPTVVFGEIERNLIGFHQTCDQIIGHDADQAVHAVHGRLPAAFPPRADA